MPVNFCFTEFLFFLIFIHGFDLNSPEFRLILGHDSFENDFVLD
jgi:hypothetical protein